MREFNTDGRFARDKTDAFAGGTEVLFLRRVRRSHHRCSERVSAVAAAPLRPTVTDLAEAGRMCLASGWPHSAQTFIVVTFGVSA